jgi:hypothetical protein
MSGWEDFKNDAGKIASKAAVKAGELTDAAAARIKLQGLRLHLCEEYEKLGRLAYKAQKDGGDITTAAVDVIAEIDKLRAAVKKIEDDIKARRDARTAPGESDDTPADDTGKPEQD